MSADIVDFDRWRVAKALGAPPPVARSPSTIERAMLAGPAADKRMGCHVRIRKLDLVGWIGSWRILPRINGGRVVVLFVQTTEGCFACREDEVDALHS